MVGYLLIGIISGLIASVLAGVLGATFWGVLGAYALAGFAVMIILPAAQIAVGALRSRRPQVPARAVSQAAGGAALVPQSEDTAQDLPQPAALRILAVDDDPLILDLIPMIAAQSGFYDVTSATSAKQALTLLNKADKPFECLLLDINMPGMNGIELCKHIRQMQAYQDTPIVMLTALRDAHNMADAFRAGATSYTTKPFDVEELCQRLELAHKMTYEPQQAALKQQRA